MTYHLEKHYRIPIYSTKLHVVVSADFEQELLNAHKIFGVEKPFSPPPRRPRAICIFQEINADCLLMFPLETISIGLIAHEVTHAVYYLVKWKQLYESEKISGSETGAMLQGYLMERICGELFKRPRIAKLLLSNQSCL